VREYQLKQVENICFYLLLGDEENGKSVPEKLLKPCG